MLIVQRGGGGGAQTRLGEFQKFRPWKGVQNWKEQNRGVVKIILHRNYREPQF